MQAADVAITDIYDTPMVIMITVICVVVKIVFFLLSNITWKRMVFPA